jgi:hypothetical protein
MYHKPVVISRAVEPKDEVSCPTAEAAEVAEKNIIEEKPGFDSGC